VSSIVQVSAVRLELVDVLAEFPDGQRIKLGMLPDTGANVSVIGADFVKRHKISVEKQAPRPITADGTALDVAGRVRMTVRLGNKQARCEAVVVKGLKQPLLSLQALKDLGLVRQDFPHSQINMITTERETRQNASESEKIHLGRGPELDALAEKFPDVFNGHMSTITGGQYHIELEADAVPVNTGCSRMIPEPFLGALKREIDAQVAEGILEPVTGATEWLHPIVVVPKKGTEDVRLCVDLRRLNQHVKRPVNPQLTPWEVVRSIPKGTRHFAVFDALRGYHQVELDEASRALTTFMTPHGRYRYARLPMGLSAAGDVFTLRYGNAVDDVVDGRWMHGGHVDPWHVVSRVAGKDGAFLQSMPRAWHHAERKQDSVESNGGHLWRFPTV
jgi:hypothetical protein